MTVVPLSRLYANTAWPIATFNVMSKPSGPACNLACEYCFYRHNQEKRHEGTEAHRHEGDPRLRPGYKSRCAASLPQEATHCSHGDDSIMTDWSITAQDWGRFLCQIFDLWWQRDRDRVPINWFHSWASQFAGGSALMCICSPVCGRSVAMERDGSVYSCDHFVYPEYRLGSVGDDGERPTRDESRFESGDESPHSRLSDLVRSKRQKDFGEGKSTSLPRYCRRCPFLFACYGECPKRRFLKTPDGEPGLNYLCPGYRVFFDYAGERLAEYGRRTMTRGRNGAWCRCQSQMFCYAGSGQRPTRL